jgi:hypothetical protein
MDRVGRRAKNEGYGRTSKRITRKSTPSIKEDNNTSTKREYDKIFGSEAVILGG